VTRKEPRAAKGKPRQVGDDEIHVHHTECALMDPRAFTTCVHELLLCPRCLWLGRRSSGNPGWGRKHVTAVNVVTVQCAANLVNARRAFSERSESRAFDFRRCRSYMTLSSMAQDRGNALISAAG
jgi:hypothetical protein